MIGDENSQLQALAAATTDYVGLLHKRDRLTVELGLTNLAVNVAKAQMMEDLQREGAAAQAFVRTDLPYAPAVLRGF